MKLPQRTNERFQLDRIAEWDFYTYATGKKTGIVADISRTGCLLKTTDPIPFREMIRMLVRSPASNLLMSWVGRVIRVEQMMEAQKVAGGADEITLYRYGLQFTFPDALAVQDLDLILALPSRNLTAASCLSLNSMSS